MKKSTLLIFVAIAIAVVVNAQTQVKTTKDAYVPDKETAVKIAEAIWLPIYGNAIYECKPFIASLKSNDIWVVQGTLKTGKGGVPYIEIQKSDCKILKVTHGK